MNATVKAEPSADMNADVQVLFVTWDGPGSAYLQGLFVPIFAALRRSGVAFHVLQFTWAAAGERRALAAACSAAGISYRSVTICRRPVVLGSLATVLWGRIHVRRAINELGIGLLMPRSTLPAIAAIPAAETGTGRIPLLLDADGLPHDERVEFNGAFSTGASYRLLRALEAWSIRRADAVTVRTLRAAHILAERAHVKVNRFHVVSNARNALLFRPPDRATREWRRSSIGMSPDQPLLVYSGSSLKGKYRGEAMLRFFSKVRDRRPDARLLLLMPQHEQARQLIAQFPDLASACLLRGAAPEEVSDWLGSSDLGLALIHATYSMQAVAAIKLGEYLLCGVPVLASSGVGQTDELIEQGIGRCLAEHDDASMEAAASWFVDVVLPNRSTFCERCREAGLRHFSLEAALPAYQQALRAALQAPAGA